MNSMVYSRRGLSPFPHCRSISRVSVGHADHEPVRPTYGANPVLRPPFGVVASGVAIGRYVERFAGRYRSGGTSQAS
jgi:hypothetical protein